MKRNLQFVVPKFEKMKYGPTFLGIIEENNVKSGTKERRMFKVVLLFQNKGSKNPQKVVLNYIK